MKKITLLLVFACSLLVSNIFSQSAPTVTSGEVTGQREITLTTSVPLFVGAEPSGENGISVTWASAVGVTATAGNLVKTGSDNAWNSGAVSIEKITSSEFGYVSSVVELQNNTQKIFGLSNGDTNQDFIDIDYAILFTAGNVEIHEKGVRRGAFGTYITGDVFKVAVLGNVVTYWKNGELLHTSAVAPTYPLLVDTSLFSGGVTLKEVKLHKHIPTDFTVSGVTTTPTVTAVTVSGTNIVLTLSENVVNGDAPTVSYAKGAGSIGLESLSGLDMASFTNQSIETAILVAPTVVSGTTVTSSSISLAFDKTLGVGAEPLGENGVSVTWASLLNVAPTPGNLVKTGGGNAWNSGAVSNEKITSSEFGYVSSVTELQNNAQKIFGLSNGDTDHSYSDIDFAILLIGPNAQIYEKETPIRTSSGAIRNFAYITGDVFRVAVLGSVVTYWKNGELLHTSAVAPTYPLLVDTSLFSGGATLKEVKLHKIALTDFTVSGVVSSPTVTGITLSGATVVLALSGNVVNGDLPKVSYAKGATSIGLESDIGIDVVDFTAQSIVNTFEVNDAPIITSPSTFLVDENQTLVATLVVTDVDAGDSPTFSTTITGDDESAFALTTEGVLTFNTAPNFEAPIDSGGNNGYEITVTATDGDGGADTQNITITVNDVNDEGTVTISGTVTQGETLTATVSDDDGITNNPSTIAYQWKATISEERTATDINGATTSTYKLTQLEVGKTITVTATYTDDGNFYNKITSGSNVEVSNTNDAPVGVDDTDSTPEETAVTISVLANDTDVDTETSLIVTNLGTPSNGTVTLTNNATEVTYTPSANFNGTDTFTYTPNDRTVDGNVVTVTVIVGIPLDTGDYTIKYIYISPNPATDNLNITVVEKADYRLLNIRGQILKRGTLAKGKNSVNISSLSKGIYLLNLKTNKGSFTKKVVKY